MTVDARVLLDRDDLDARVQRLAGEITAAHPDGVVLIAVLKGALVFAADLARAITGTPLVLDFLAISRYAPDSGRVRILKDVDVEIADRDVVMVEDLVDTGLTLAYLLGHVRDRGARSVEVCTLLDRAERRIVPTEVHYVGERVAADAFVVGYGLHVGERYRNLPFVLQVDRAGLAADPTGCLEWYGAAVPTRGATRADSGASRGRRPGEGPENADAMVADELERRRP
ncbi:MAG: phosphoribosyltransferase family protein [Acidimicrobiia bacterium]